MSARLCRIGQRPEQTGRTLQAHARQIKRPSVDLLGAIGGTAEAEASQSRHSTTTIPAAGASLPTSGGHLCPHALSSSTLGSLRPPALRHRPNFGPFLPRQFKFWTHPTARFWRGQRNRLVFQQIRRKARAHFVTLDPPNSTRCARVMHLARADTKTADRLDPSAKPKNIYLISIIYFFSLTED